MIEIIHEVNKKYGIPEGTAWNHLHQGYCAWPRKFKPSKKSQMMKHHPLYKPWDSMKQRCSNPRARGYSYYGGRGIRVCKQWQTSFWQFVQDVGNKPNSKYTLDRIDVNDGYHKNNCKWSTPKEQAKNTRKGLGGLYFEKSSKRWMMSYGFSNKQKAISWLNKIRKEDNQGLWGK